MTSLVRSTVCFHRSLTWRPGALINCTASQETHRSLSSSLYEQTGEGSGSVSNGNIRAIVSGTSVAFFRVSDAQFTPRSQAHPLRLSRGRCTAIGASIT